MKKRKAKILFTGGGTGGHIFPIVAIVRELRKIYPDSELEIFYAGPKDELGEIAFKNEGIKIKNILSGKIRRYLGIKPFFQNILDIIKIFLGIIQSFFYLFFLNPDLIFSKGGYGSLPVVISGALLGIPIFLHESDVIPGKSNRLAAKFAFEIFVSFPKTEIFSKKKMIVVGNPIRKELLEGSEKEAKEIFKIQGGKPVIFIMGGSQGAQAINNIVLDILNKILKEFEIIHQTGSKNFEKIKKEIEIIIPENLKPFYHPYPFLKEDKLKHAYKISDIIISRAGSGSIFEIAAVGKPSILIPLPSAAQNHQLKNAYRFAESGACIVIEEENFTPYFFLARIKQLFEQPGKLDKMREAALRFARPRAGEIIAFYIKEYLQLK